MCLIPAGPRQKNKTTARVSAGLRATTSPVQPHKPDAHAKAVRTAKPLRFAPFPLGRLVVAPAGARRADSAGRESEVVPANCCGRFSDQNTYRALLADLHLIECSSSLGSFF